MLPPSLRGAKRRSNLGAAPLPLGQMAVLRHAIARPARASRWLAGLMARRPRLVVAVAMAAKTARIIWAMLTRGEAYRPPSAPARA